MSAASLQNAASAAPREPAGDPMVVKGDCEPAAPVQCPGNLVVEGTIRQGAIVRAAGNIVIRGAVEAADVRAGGDITVEGGIAANGAGKMVAGGRIVVKFCDAAELQAGGDIVVQKDVSNSTIYTAGKLDVSQGAVVGGTTQIREGAVIREIGGDAGVVTQVSLGMDPASAARVEEIRRAVKKKQEASAVIRQKVEPLMKMVKRLTAHQREQATELLCRADEVDAEIRDLEKEVAEIQTTRKPSGIPALLVTGMAYPWAKVSFEIKTVTFECLKRGPFTLTRQPRGDEIVFRDEKTQAESLPPPVIRK